MPRNDMVKKEWNESAGAWMDFVRSGKDFYRDGLNNPAAFQLIGDVNNLSVLDIACGEGYNARILARKGAKVTGVDFSEKMIRLAKQLEEKEKLDIRYENMNAADLMGLRSGYFDLATCFMSLQDIENLEIAVSEVSRVLKRDGRFIFSIPHPCFEIMRMSNRGKNKTTCPIRYFGSKKYTINWDMKRLTKHFKTSSFHRTLTCYFDALHKSNYLVARLIEPRPSRKRLSKFPGLSDVLMIPQSIIIEAVKIGDGR